MPEYVSVADVSSLPPGQGRTVNVKGREFALFNVDGRFFAMDNECPHRGAPLGAGMLQKGRVHCPLHGWAFDPKTGACFSNPAKALTSYPTRVMDGMVQIAV